MERFNAHNTLALPAIVVLCLYVAACGGATRGTRSASRSSTSVAISPSPSITGDYDSDDDYADKLHSDGDNDDSTQPKDRDNDSDNRTHNYYDSDDIYVRRSGHAASATDKQAIAALIRRYFATANAEDGAMACSMIVSSFAKAVPENLGGPAGPPFARGTTCAGVMSRIFEHYHRQLAAHAATLEVSGVRVDRDLGLALLAFKTLPARQIRVAKEGGVWRMDALLDTELP